MHANILLSNLCALIGISCFSSELALPICFEHEPNTVNYSSSDNENNLDDSYQKKLNHQLITTIAAKNYNVALLDKLLFYGADPNFQHTMYLQLPNNTLLAQPGILAGMTPLGILSREEYFSEEMRRIADLLIDYGAKIDKECAYLYPPLGFAIKSRNFGFAMYALNNGADPKNIKSIDAMISGLEKNIWIYPNEAYALIRRIHSRTIKKPITAAKTFYSPDVIEAKKMIESDHESESIDTSEQNIESTENSPTVLASDSWTIHRINTISIDDKDINSDYAIHSIKSVEYYSPSLDRTWNDFRQVLVNYVGKSL